MKQYFRPEFLNRIDDVIVFNYLGKDQIEKIVSIQIDKLNAILAAKKITLQLSETVRQYLAKEGFDPEYGARPLKRVLQRLLQDKLALKILQGDIHEGETLHVELGKKDEIIFRKESH